MNQQLQRFTMEKMTLDACFVGVCVKFTRDGQNVEDELVGNQNGQTGLNVESDQENMVRMVSM